MKTSTCVVDSLYFGMGGCFICICSNIALYHVVILLPVQLIFFLSFYFMDLFNLCRRILAILKCSHCSYTLLESKNMCNILSVVYLKS